MVPLVFEGLNPPLKTDHRKHQRSSDQSRSKRGSLAAAYPPDHSAKGGTKEEREEILHRATMP